MEGRGEIIYLIAFFVLPFYFYSPLSVLLFVGFTKVHLSCTHSDGWFDCLSAVLTCWFSTEGNFAL